MPFPIPASERIHEFTPYSVSSRMKDWTGARTGRLVALRSMKHPKLKGVFWECACDCGKSTIVNANSMGQTTSCGCFQKENMSQVKRKHGLSHSPTNRAWSNMKGRCNNSWHRQFKDYGGRGISYDPRWESFDKFLADMGVAPPGMELDRYPDNNGNYTKANCRWATCEQNQNNKRDNVMVEYRGERLTVAELARKAGMAHDQIYGRLRRGWTAEQAVSIPVGGGNVFRRGEAPKVMLQQRG